jgi:two-component system cell cycle response regulator
VDPLIARACDAAVREERDVSILLCDPDRLERVNAAEGHAVADRLLRALAFEVRGRLRDNDLVARHDRGRVIVVLPDVTSEIAPRIAERIRRHVEAYPFELGLARPLSLTISIGCATLTGARAEGDVPGPALAEALLAAADQAIAAAKAEGRNRVARHRVTVKAA